MKLLAKGTWETKMNIDRQKEPLSLLAQSRHEKISLEPLSGLVLIEKTNENGDVVAEELLSVKEALRKFSLFPTEAREKAFWKLKEVAR